MKAKLENYKGEIYEKPLDAIHAKCLDCSVYDEREVKLCACTSCSLWPFRFGTTPYKQKRVISEEQRKAASERMKEINNRKGV